jgi:ribosomal protein S18 acetylase RimI-like enzyme
MSEIRRLTPDDSEAFAQLRRRAYETDPSAFAGLPSDEPTFDPQRVAERLRAGADGTSVVLGAFRSGLVGSLGVVCDQPARWRHKARLWGFYVEPSHRRQHLGRKLLFAACAHTASLGVEQLYLKVSTESAAAVAAYEGFGFSTFGRDPHALKGPQGYSDELHMVLFLETLTA